MRDVSCETIINKVAQAITEISFRIDPKVNEALKTAYTNETKPLAKDALESILANHSLAPSQEIPLCQDTGTTVVFAELGTEIHFADFTLQEAIDKAVIKAAAEVPLRASMYQDPLYKRVNTKDNSPAILHIEQVKGSDLVLKIAQKGGGAENMSFMQMFSPSATKEEIIDYIVKKVVEAGSRPCPPLVLGIGLGGNFELAPLLAKKALFRPLGEANEIEYYAGMEREIVKRINISGTGIQGCGGEHTAIAAHILCAPCHIASLPVAVNINCHAHRHIEVRI